MTIDGPSWWWLAEKGPSAQSQKAVERDDEDAPKDARLLSA